MSTGQSSSAPPQLCRMVCPGPANQGTHSGVIDRATAYSGGRMSKACATPSESWAQYSKAIRRGDAVLLKREPTRQERDCHRSVFLFDADLRANAVPPQSSVERQADLTAEQQSKGSSSHLHTIGRLLDQTSADTVASQ
jgi:hypothetical protein